MIRIDVSYPHGFHAGEQFPASPSTLFQAVVASNGYRLDSVTDVLEAFEQSTCLRIVQRTKAEPVRFDTAVPRLPAKNDIKNIRVFQDTAGKVNMLVYKKDDKTKQFKESPESLLKPNTLFMLEPAAVHVSYYFGMIPGDFPLERLRDILRLNVLGRGESVAMSSVFVVDALPVAEMGTVLEPATHGRQLQVPYAGFLRNLRLLYNNKQSPFEVPKESVKFAARDSVAPYATICYDLVDADGETFSYPQKNMADIAAMMRHALTCATQGKVSVEYVAGHAKEHPFYLPIPTIGHEHADGAIRRVVVAEPGSGLLKDHLAAITALNLVNTEGKLVCRALRRTSTDYVLDQYLQPAKVFRTVTPMVLDRNGGETRVGKRINALLQRAGYPAPTKVAFNRTQWHGKLPVRTVRAAVHVEVEFPVPVEGPVAAGVASGYGIGLFYANQAGL